MSGKSVLIVDDNKEITDMLSKFLKTNGFETVVTNDAMEGLRHIQQEKYDVILLDIVMPEFSGLQIIGTLATDEILQDQNIFMFSANFGHDNQIKDLLRRDGVNGCLKKPIQLYELLTAITRRGIFQTPSRLEQFSSFPKNNLKNYS